MAQQLLSGSTTKLSVNLVTPKGVVAQVEVDGVTAPGELGEMELLPGHVPLLTSLDPGVVTLGTKQGSPRFAVSVGYLKIDRAGSVEILVDEAVKASDVDVEAARRDLAAAEADIAKWGDKPFDGDRRTLEHRAQWAHARIDAATH